jgi:hypothetical protein
MNLSLLLAMAVALSGLHQDAVEAPANEANRETNRETRYSVSLTEEGSFAGGLRVPGPSSGNLLLLQPSFAYKDGDRWRFATSLAALSDTGGDTHTQVRVREAFAGLSLGDFDFSAGRKLLRWGTGYAFTATGILDPPRVATDPTDRLSLNEGVNLVQGDFTKNGSDVTVVWADTGARQTTAVRYNKLIDGFDTSVIVAQDRAGPSFAGANFTRVLGDRVELHGEFAWRQGAAVLMGGKYTTSSGVTFIGEFYTPPNTAFYRDPGLPASLGRQQYAFLRAGKDRLRELPGWKEWDVSASIVVNLTDGSRIGVFDAGRRFGDHFFLYTHGQVPAGKKWQSEYGSIPYSALVSVGVRFQL